MKSLGIKWRSFSINDPRFDIEGYTNPEDDYQEDATKAMEEMSKLVGKPIPSDAQLGILGTEQ